ncbi:branched-chain amino acid transport system substrate-binding protein [Rhizobiales bacterium GAS191]|nr:branched-chain amino acid transport system substrate-binding protein [Rhizobiales bacterium GAS191]
MTIRFLATRFLATRFRATACIAALALLAFGAVAARADIVVGVALPRTGPVASVGEQVFKGATAAAKDINDKGGILGQKLVLEFEDDACDPKQAVSIANRFLQNGTRLIVGHVCSGASIVASDIYAENGMLMVSAASNSAKLTDRGLPGIFRVCGRDDQQGELIARILSERIAGRKIAILHDKTPYSKGIVDAVKVNLNAHGVNETLFDAINPGERDYTAVITRLKASGIGLVFYGGYHPEMGTLVRQAAEQGYEAQWFGTSGISTKEFSAIAGPASDGVLMTFNPDPRRHSEAASVVSAFKAQGVDPEGFTLYAYTAVQVLAEAAEMGNSADPKAVAATLKAKRFPTILGEVGFDAKGDITAPGYVLYVWRGGNFQPVD